MIEISSVIRFTRSSSGWLARLHRLVHRLEVVHSRRLVGLAALAGAGRLPLVVRRGRGVPGRSAVLVRGRGLEGLRRRRAGRDTRRLVRAAEDSRAARSALAAGSATTCGGRTQPICGPATSVPVGVAGGVFIGGRGMGTGSTAWLSCPSGPTTGRGRMLKPPPGSDGPPRGGAEMSSIVTFGPLSALEPPFRRGDPPPPARIPR